MTLKFRTKKRGIPPSLLAEWHACLAEQATDACLSVVRPRVLSHGKRSPLEAGHRFPGSDSSEIRNRYV